MKASELLKKAKALIEKHGWTQNAFRDSDGGYCAIGACWAAIGVDPVADVAAFSSHSNESALVTLLARRLGRAANVVDIVNYNDVHGRTAEQVLARFDVAIAAAEQEEASS